jgi:hypothetical protein
MTQEDQSEQPPNPPSIDIDPGILAALQLTPEDLKQYQRHTIEMQQFREEMMQKGAKEYEKAKPGDIGKVWMQLGGNALGIETPTRDNFFPPKHEIPDLVVERWEKAKLNIKLLTKTKIWKNWMQEYKRLSRVGEQKH